MSGQSIRSRIEAELRTAMARLGGDPLQPLTYDAFALAGADPEMLSIIGSINDTLRDEDVLTYLLEINAGRPVIVEGLASGGDQ